MLTETKIRKRTRNVFIIKSFEIGFYVLILIIL